MSADNWAVCPRCCEEVIIEEVIIQEAERLENIKKSYGKVTSEEYLVLVEAKPMEIERTLREDYEIGIWEGRFQISYRGHCGKCGFEKSFNLDEEITGLKERGE